MSKNKKIIKELIEVGDQFSGVNVVGKTKEETKENLQQFFKEQRDKNKK